MGKALLGMLLDSTRTYILLLSVLLNLPKRLGIVVVSNSGLYWGSVSRYLYNLVFVALCAQ